MTAHRDRAFPSQTFSLEEDFWTNRVAGSAANIQDGQFVIYFKPVTIEMMTRGTARVRTRDGHMVQAGASMRKVRLVRASIRSRLLPI